MSTQLKEDCGLSDRQINATNNRKNLAGDASAQGEARTNKDQKVLALDKEGPRRELAGWLDSFLSVPVAEELTYFRVQVGQASRTGQST